MHQEKGKLKSEDANENTSHYALIYIDETESSVQVKHPIKQYGSVMALTLRWPLCYPYIAQHPFYSGFPT
jgi:hypothetical protein